MYLPRTSKTGDEIKISGFKMSSYIKTQSIDMITGKAIGENYVMEASFIVENTSDLYAGDMISFSKDPLKPSRFRVLKTEKNIVFVKSLICKLPIELSQESVYLVGVPITESYGYR